MNFWFMIKGLMVGVDARKAFDCSSTWLGGKKCHSREGALQIKCQMGLGM